MFSFLSGNAKWYVGCRTEFIMRFRIFFVFGVLHLGKLLQLSHETIKHGTWCLNVSTCIARGNDVAI